MVDLKGAFEDFLKEVSIDELKGVSLDGYSIDEKRESVKTS